MRLQDLLLALIALPETCKYTLELKNLFGVTPIFRWLTVRYPTDILLFSINSMCRTPSVLKEMT
jgi:hypothetical protein